MLDNHMRSVLFLLVAVPCLASKRTLSTWIGPGQKGPSGADATEALEWVTKHKDHISSLSTIGYGSPGARNISGKLFNERCKSMGIDTYVLWGGQWESFSTPEAIKATVNQTLAMVKDRGFTGVDLDFEHPQTWGPDFVNMNKTFQAELKSKYSDFLRAMSAALHAEGLKMSECVGTYPTASGGVDVFYDTAVLAETNDVVRVMNYDMYYVGGRGGSFPGRPDCTGMGPTSTKPWAEFSMKWWLQRIPVEKLVMGLPAYSNDYSALPGYGGGNGTQQSVGAPANATRVEKIWDFWSQIYTYMYNDKDGHPRIRYGTEVDSTKAQLKTAEELGVSAVGFWTANSMDSDMDEAFWEWCAAGEKN